MAFRDYGGGTWVTQNKKLPGVYINYISQLRIASTVGERGIVAAPALLDWGEEGAFIPLSSDDFYKSAIDKLGYDYDANTVAMRNIRDLFKAGTRQAYIYNISSGGAKAENTYATAKHPGIRGNDITIRITANATTAANFDVATIVDGKVVDEQTDLVDATKLVNNTWVDFKTGATLALTAGEPLTGGTTGTALAVNYQTFLSKLHQYSFNILLCDSDVSAIKDSFVTFVKDQRENYGIKFQVVLHRYESADCEGVISVDNNDNDASLVYWVSGKEASCALNASVANQAYDGEAPCEVNYTQKELEEGLSGGRFMFHRANDNIVVLADINTLHTFVTNKGQLFGYNQTIRVIDEIGNDYATIFDTKYIGKVQNNDGGRLLLWNDLDNINTNLNSTGAIQGYSSSDLKVEAGTDKNDVYVSLSINIAGTMEKLYMEVMIV
jgi:hypothetical protein